MLPSFFEMNKSDSISQAHFFPFLMHVMKTAVMCTCMLNSWCLWDLYIQLSFSKVGSQMHQLRKIGHLCRKMAVCMLQSRFLGGTPDIIVHLARFNYSYKKYENLSLYIWRTLTRTKFWCNRYRELYGTDWVNIGLLEAWYAWDTPEG